ncbi:MAG TPA: PDZ domain-containing protein, partial [Opitutales bacterium]|nr:PDZ domain-containing protein [Opitutales bacterium]
PAATAGLRPNDWIKEIDGIEISEYSQAIELLTQAMEEERNEIVFLTSRQNETSVIRVRIR